MSMKHPEIHDFEDGSEEHKQAVERSANIGIRTREKQL